MRSANHRNKRGNYSTNTIVSKEDTLAGFHFRPSLFADRNLGMFIFKFRQEVGGSGSSQVEVKRGTNWNHHNVLPLS